MFLTLRICSSADTRTRSFFERFSTCSILPEQHLLFLYLSSYNYTQEMEFSLSARRFSLGTLPAPAGPDSLGYYSTAASADASCIITNSYMGALHAWCREATTIPPSQAALTPTLPPLFPQPFVTGHWRDITAHLWAIDGQCILTASADQTVRLHACTHGSSSRCGIEHSYMHVQCSALVSRGGPRLRCVLCACSVWCESVSSSLQSHDNFTTALHD